MTVRPGLTAWDAWLRDYRPAAQPRVRLVCFPHAGGSASFYRTWARLYPVSVQTLVVQYPGREDRLSEPFITDMDQLADQVSEVLLGASDLPLALFGHSMGAAVAYEVARRLEPAGRAVRALIVSGRPAPHRQREKSLHLADDARLTEELRRFGKTPEGVFAETALRELVLSTTRNDYTLIETYEPRCGPALRCPIHVLLSVCDTEVTRDEAEAWGDLTEAACSVRRFAGGHFYLKTNPAPVIQAVVELLGPRLDGSPRSVITAPPDGQAGCDASS